MGWKYLELFAGIGGMGWLFRKYPALIHAKRMAAKLTSKIEFMTRKE